MDRTKKRKQRNGNKKGCTVTIIPFDCTKRTCECNPLDNIEQSVSENYLIRFDSRPASTNSDKLRLIFKNTIDCSGKLTVTRSGEQVSQANIDCKTIRQCLVAIDSTIVHRPPIKMEDGTGAMSINEAFTGIQRAWQGDPQNPIPDVRPYTKRERYSLKVECCDAACSDTLNATGWDCDLILLAYQMLYLASISTAGLLIGVDTIRQFFASMAIRGAKALCDLYHQSAINCDRRFQDVNAAACLSAVLAEETWQAQVKQIRGQPLSARWQAYYNEPNLTMVQLDLTSFRRYGDLFADAHLKDGLAKGFRAVPSPCRAHDLNVVVETLTSVQAPHIMQAVGAITSSMVGTTVSDEFKRRLRQRMLDALGEVGETSTADTLRQQWNLP